MRTNSPLPDEIARSPFLVREARAAGVARGRLSSRDLQRPFHGVRATGLDLSNHRDRCRALLPRLDGEARFSHFSAAAILLVPLPRRIADEPVHITVFAPRRAPQLRGVVSHELEPRGESLAAVDGLPIVGPADTWVRLASALRETDLVAAGDFLVTGDEPYSGAPPLCSLDDLGAAVRRHAGVRGLARARRALELVRYGPLSPRETRLRLLLLSAGMPEPELNFRLRASDSRTMVDLAYPAERVAVEYQGGHHRTDAEVYDDDILRRERLEAEGWVVVYVTARELDRYPERLIRRIRSHLTFSPDAPPPVEHREKHPKRKF
jgi:very-short-patch-repair endonuclease